MAFLDIRANVIRGEYDWVDARSSSGIFGSQAAAPAPNSPPPTVGYGISIAHNTIAHAKTNVGGAIVIAPTWWQGPPPGNWPLTESLLIFKNNLLELCNSANRHCGGYESHRQVGINLARSTSIANAVLYGNRCDATVLIDLQRTPNILKLCRESTSDMCECAR